MLDKSCQSYNVYGQAQHGRDPFERSALLWVRLAPIEHVGVDKPETGQTKLRPPFKPKLGCVIDESHPQSWASLRADLVEDASMHELDQPS
ncbi:hypothetical protein M8818_003942 [Zalaria obscura]|uniref:Uncharacterized protein n=1 Tax=Zalaria obscura TaxID=2024903 RepID=A0ACC3SD33_9PEZI